MDTLNSGIVEGITHTVEETLGELNLVPGKHGNAIYFDGRSTARLTPTGTSCLFDPTECSEGLTTAMWIKAGDKDSSNMFFYSNGGHKGLGVAFSLQDRQLKVVIRMPGKIHRVRSNVNIQRGIWYHVAYSWTKQQNIKLYVNGDLSNADVSDEDESNSVGSLDFYFGTRNDDVVNPGSKWGEFTIDEFLFIPSKSTSATIKRLYEASKGTFVVNLISYTTLPSK